MLGNVEDFADFGMGLLFRQLADESPKVVRHAVRLLNTWIPASSEFLSINLQKYPQSLRYLKNIRVESLGEAGLLLQAHLFEDEYYVAENRKEALKALQLWMDVGFGEAVIRATFSLSTLDTLRRPKRACD